MEVPRGDADACPDAFQAEFQEVRERYSCHGEPPKTWWLAWDLYSVFWEWGTLNPAQAQGGLAVFPRERQVDHRRPA